MDVYEPDVFVLADRAIDRVVQQVTEEQWDWPVPDYFARRDPTSRPTLRDVVGYHAYDDAWVPDMVAGRTMTEVGTGTFSGDLLGDDPKLAFAEIVERACAAVAALTPPDLDRVAHCSFGDFPVREYLWQVTLFRGGRAVDIARMIGADPTLEPALVEGLWVEVSPHAEEWRAIGVLGPRVEVADDAPLLDRLLGLTGRQPNMR
jgi:hypothetical protein